MRLSLRVIPSIELDGVWKEIAPMLERPLTFANDGTTIGDVYEQLKSRQSMLWTASTDKTVMALVLTNENNWLYAWLIGGSGIDDWLGELLRHMKRYAREFGYRGLKTVTRPGLARRLRKEGWKTEAEIIRIKL